MFRKWSGGKNDLSCLKTNLSGEFTFLLLRAATLGVAGAELVILYLETKLVIIYTEGIKFANISNNYLILDSTGKKYLSLKKNDEL